MLSSLKRDTIQVLVAAGHTYVDVARFAGVNERTVQVSRGRTEKKPV